MEMIQAGVQGIKNLKMVSGRPPTIRPSRLRIWDFLGDGKWRLIPWHHIAVVEMDSLDPSEVDQTAGK
jgi:hypothetical protein